MAFQPMPLSREPAPFDHPDWLFEIKHDGFRALAYVRNGECRLVSRKGNTYQRFSPLSVQIVASLNAKSAVLDGEIVCLDADGKSQFKSLMYRRGEPYFYAFDILQLNGKDLRSMPLIRRKQHLRRAISNTISPLLYVDHIDQRGTDLFELACREDLEVAKRHLRLPTGYVLDQDQEPGIHANCRQRKTV
jgi:bifunctional non-homologous end joining protein LigD